MILKELKPRKALNKAFLKVKPNRTEIEEFKTNLIQLLDRTNDTESEEFHKNLVSDFLKKTYYEPNHFINTKGRNDLVIHNGNNANSSVGVIIEAKKPTNKAEMITTNKLNAKAFQELVLYYLRERITHKNLEVKHLIATNINEWFIFDATLFDRLFAQNKNFVKQFTDFESGRLADTKTDFFYKQIAKPFIDDIKSEIEFTYFNIQDYQEPLRNTEKADDNLLIALFKLLSAEHLLKLPFINDSNSLDKKFYSELLHIIGLTETKQGSKKLIERNKEGERNSGSILENTIIQLDSLDKINRLNQPSQFGKTQQERLFNVALELSITWINRILFLKLLEAQLIAYHKGDKAYSFLNLDKIKNYDDLNSLFFQVLARKHKDRNQDVQQAFENVPYLNSSLFEPTEMEQITLFISNLKDEKTIPVISSTVLKDDQGKKQTGEVKNLEYLFEFLNAYDFASEGSEEIQEDNKSLINASVLGLIFEKINGYKDGSFFTPGFITMYMCRETIRKSVIQKFNETKKWNCSTLEELYDKIEDRKEANEIVNSIKICDPAVGSGHFLVSALNEIIALKSEMRILLDKTGKRLKETSIRVINDALYITDIESDEEHYYIAPAPRSEKTVRYIFGGDSFKYTPSFVTERQRIQETIFHEKQTIIENCLFGVDINPNSVKICRLRLWIELLKNAYYTPESNFTELETLPNIDINIKCGNSLVSRFDIDSNLSQALKKSKWTIESYRNAVATYRNAQNKEQKREMERLISDIKLDFRTEINKNDPKLAKLYKLNGELTTLTTQQSIFGMSDKEKKEWNKKVTQLTEETKKLETEIEDIKTSKIYENAFEWRFEFPEVLNENGDFVGFDVVIGNPPYFSISKLDTNQLDYFSNSNYQTFIKSTDIYCLFIELAQKIGSNLGINHFIVSNKWLTANYGQKTRTFLAEHTSNIFIIDFNKFQIFDEAIVDACLLSFSNKNGKRVDYLEYDIKEKTESVTEFLSTISSSTKVINLLDTWNLGGFEYQAIKDKMEVKGKSLNAWNIKFYRGITTGFNDAFVIDENTKNKLIKEDKKNASIIKPLLRGRDIKKYGFEKGLLWLINAHNGLKSIQLKPLDIENNFSSIYNYLNQYKTALINRTDKGDNYTNLRNCAYLEEFEKEKLVFTKASKIQAFAYDNKGHFVLNTSYILVGEKLKYLLALLNSKLFQFGFKNFYQSGGIEGEITIQAIKQIPIVYPTEKQESKINKIVEKIILLKEKDYVADTTALESQIDQLVYQLYELTEEEIKIIEGT